MNYKNEMQFYPTPTEVIDIMLKPYELTKKEQDEFNYKYDLSDKYILDPSAGKGDIFKHINEHINHFDRNSNRFFAIEIDPTLQETLSSYTLIGEDFLNYNGDILFDFIFMNPPFNNGDSHLLHAWDILYKGDIVCLLNAETILNPYTSTREQLVKLIDKHGSYEVLGNVFSNAENKTEVNVALVRLTKKVNNKFDFKFDLKGTEKVPGELNEETINKGEVAVNDIIGSTVMQYEQLRDSYIDYLKAIEKLQYYSKGLLSEYNDINKLAYDSIDYKGRNKVSFNEFTSSIKSNAWKVVLSKSGIEKYMTTAIRKNFNSFISKKGETSFSKENIFGVIRMVVMNSDKILEQAICDSFDMLTNYSENRSIVETWKTNDKWKVNRKVIIPNYIRMSWEKPSDRIKYGDEFRLEYSHYVNFSDIDKALCYMTGKKFEEIYSMDAALKDEFKLIGKIYKGPFPKFECTSTFFKLRFYLRGTVHITFLDKKLWEDFNIRATKLKNWLPEPEYDEWKMKRRYKEQVPKSHRIEKEIKEPIQSSMF